MTKNNYYTPPQIQSLEVRTDNVICLSLEKTATSQEFEFRGENYAW